MKGPLATAGSILNLFMINGIIEPTNVPTVIAHVRLPPTISANKGCLYITTIIKNSTTEQTKPDKNPLPASLKAILNLLCSLISPVEILRTETARIEYLNYQTYH